MPADSLFDQALKAEGVTGKLADLARSIYTQESTGGKNSKTSNRGAVGGMQILPSTFRSVAEPGWRIDDPMENARGGIRYLKQLDKQSGGIPELTAAGYYGGPGGMEKARRGIAVADPKNPNAPTTLEYGAQVAARAGQGGGKVAPAPVVVAQAPTPAPVAPAAAFVASALAPNPELASPMTVAVAPPAVAPVETVPQGQPGPDAWSEFLRTMPEARRVAVTPEDLNFSFRPPVVADIRPSIQGAVAPSLMPNFAAFQAWKGRAA